MLLLFALLTLVSSHNLNLLVVIDSFFVSSDINIETSINNVVKIYQEQLNIYFTVKYVNINGMIHPPIYKVCDTIFFRCDDNMENIVMDYIGDNYQWMNVMILVTDTLINESGKNIQGFSRGGGCRSFAVCSISVFSDETGMISLYDDESDLASCIAHELGHSVGADHDNNKNCPGSGFSNDEYGSPFIMGLRHVFSFSDCSVKTITRSLENLWYTKC